MTIVNWIPTNFWYSTLRKILQKISKKLLTFRYHKAPYVLCLDSVIKYNLLIPNDKTKISS